MILLLEKSPESQELNSTHDQNVYYFQFWTFSCIKFAFLETTRKFTTQMEKLFLILKNIF